MKRLLLIQSRLMNHIEVLVPRSLRSVVLVSQIERSGCKRGNYSIASKSKSKYREIGNFKNLAFRTPLYHRSDKTPPIEKIGQEFVPGEMNAPKFHRLFQSSLEKNYDLQVLIYSTN